MNYFTDDKDFDNDYYEKKQEEQVDKPVNPNAPEEPTDMEKIMATFAVVCQKTIGKAYQTARDKIKSKSREWKKGVISGIIAANIALGIGGIAINSANNKALNTKLEHAVVAVLNEEDVLTSFDKEGHELTVKYDSNNNPYTIINGKIIDLSFEDLDYRINENADYSKVIAQNTVPLSNVVKYYANAIIKYSKQDGLDVKSELWKFYRSFLPDVSEELINDTIEIMLNTNNNHINMGEVKKDIQKEGINEYIDTHNIVTVTSKKGGL